jgi:hypothetical protein
VAAGGAESPLQFGISLVPATENLDRIRELVRVETLATFVDDGFDTLVFWPVDTVPGQVELLAGDVVPRVREAIPQR